MSISKSSGTKKCPKNFWQSIIKIVGLPKYTSTLGGWVQPLYYPKVLGWFAAVDSSGTRWVSASAVLRSAYPVYSKNKMIITILFL